MIVTKAQMYRALERGAFGNHLRSWTTDAWSQLATKDRPPLLGLRSTTHDHSYFKGRIPLADLQKEMELIIPKVGPQYRICEAAPDKDLVIQGYLMDRPGGKVLDYSLTRGLTMREAQPNFKHATGAMVPVVLQDFLDPHDYEHLNELLDKYPDHVIEFSTFRRRLGTEDKPTVIWEVRAY